MRLIVTGGAGFIGSNWVRRRLKRHPDDVLVVIDHLGYASSLQNLAGLERHAGYRFMRGDVAHSADVSAAFDLAEDGNRVDAVMHFAAESHVDRSIDDAGPFVRSNVLGTQVLLDVARKRKARRFVHISTDEVYGSLDLADRPFTEESPLLPNSPYAASKAGADCLARAAFQTFGLPVIITRGSNSFGPGQFIEKLIPLLATNALEDKPLPIYGDGRQRRDWLHVDDHCDALDAVLSRGREGEVYNIGGGDERENIQVARFVCHATGRPETLIEYVIDRLGHDRRYAVETRKIEHELGFRPSIPFEQGLDATVRWYEQHRERWMAVKKGPYREYYERQYSGRNILEVLEPEDE